MDQMMRLFQFILVEAILLIFYSILLYAGLVFLGPIYICLGLLLNAICIIILSTRPILEFRVGRLLIVILPTSYSVWTPLFAMLEKYEQVFPLVAISLVYYALGVVCLYGHTVAFEALKKR
jgi:hypothetical protein